MESTQVSFTAKDVMALRQKTALGMMDCKKALAETNGDMAAAEEWLRAQKKGKMDTRTERVTGEGRIGVAIDGSSGAIIEVRTETDFTARTDGFVKLIEDIARHAVGAPAGDVTISDEITTRIDDVRITTGENVNFARGIKLEGGSFGKYIHHDGKRGVLIQVEGAADDDLLKGLCQHIVFHDPLGISEKDVPADQLQAIRDDALSQAREAGKNDEIAQKIAGGKVRKHLEERTLLYQKYVLDDTKSVRDVVPEGVTIKRFVRYTLGGG